jgi:hypothetical protein
MRALRRGARDDAEAHAGEQKRLFAVARRGRGGRARRGPGVAGPRPAEAPRRALTRVEPPASRQALAVPGEGSGVQGPAAPDL